MTPMDEIDSPDALYQSTRRSVRLRGSVTSIRLENGFWQVLAEMAEKQGCSLPQLINKLHDDLSDTQLEQRNFASFLRVVCAKYLAEKAEPVQATSSEPSTEEPAI